MKNLDLNSMGVHEMNALEMKETDGGNWLTDLLQLLEYTIQAGIEYSKYSAATGGQYVIHHAY